MLVSTYTRCAVGICRRFSNFRCKSQVHDLNKTHVIQESRIHTSKRTWTGEKLEKLHKPTNFEKKILVINGSYPSAAEVPEMVSHAQMLRAKDWFRIRVNIGMCLATVLACVLVAYSGKQAAKRGESLSQQNLEWHQKNQETASTKEK